MLVLGMVGYAWAQDEGAQTYAYTTDGKIIVTAYMTGVAFSLDATTWTIGQVTPSQILSSDAYKLQNDGGVNIDLTFEMIPDAGADVAWTADDDIDVTPDYSTFPATDKYYLEPLLTDAGDTRPAASTNYSLDGTYYDGTGLIEGTAKEATVNLFAEDVSTADANGLNLPAYVPGNNDGDDVYINLLFIAPASITGAPGAGNVHTHEIKITASLSS